jgi:hypothetical protein
MQQDAKYANEENSMELNLSEATSCSAIQQFPNI